MFSSERLSYGLVVLLLALTVGGAPPIAGGASRESKAKAQESGYVPAGYRLAWSDDFDGDSLDAGKWNYRTDSKALSTQLPANVSVSGGLLHIALKKEKANGKLFTGGGVISKKEFKYGYYEARFRVPPGRGWHTSFWTMQHAAKTEGKSHLRDQEIDICEQDSVDPFRYSAGVIDWSGKKGRGFGREYHKTPNLAAGFHVWGCEFTATEVKFYFDGKLTHKTDAAKFPHGPQSIWLTSIAYPSGKPEKIVDESKLPAEAVFDWVRFYVRQ